MCTSPFGDIDNQQQWTIFLQQLFVLHWNIEFLRTFIGFNFIMKMLNVAGGYQFNFKRDRSNSVCHNLQHFRKMSCAFVYLLGIVLLLTSWGDARNIQCPELPGVALKAILGTTYNPRYMSIQPPMDDGTNTGRGPKRSSIFVEHDFYMEGDFDENPYEGIPAWDVDHVEIGEKQRTKRTPQPPSKKRDVREVFIERITSKSKRNVFQSRPWECKAEIEWIDLGPDYFPRYLRSVQCKKTSCWYGHYTCKPKRFSIKVLRRSTGQCAKVSQRLKIVTLDTVSGEYAQQWEFEEKAVTFCCDCEMNY